MIFFKVRESKKHLGPGNHPSGSPQSVHGRNKEDSYDVKRTTPFAANPDTDWHNVWYDKYDSFTEKQIKAIRMYTGDQYDIVNNTLREGKERPYFGDQVESFETVVSGLDEIAENELSRAPENFLVFRGYEVDDKTIEILKDAEGSYGSYFLSDKGFMSTSVSQRVAQKFRDPKDENGVFLELEVPKGTKCFPLVGSFGDEGEVVFARGTKFSLTTVEFVEYEQPTYGVRGYWHLKGRVI